MKNNSLPREIWDYLKTRKKWWLTPIIIMLALISILIIAGQSTPISPLVYGFF